MIDSSALLVTPTSELQPIKLRGLPLLIAQSTPAEKYSTIAERLSRPRRLIWTSGRPKFDADYTIIHPLGNPCS